MNEYSKMPDLAPEKLHFVAKDLHPSHIPYEEILKVEKHIVVICS
jgi:hypothetical protein